MSEAIAVCCGAAALLGSMLIGVLWWMGLPAVDVAWWGLGLGMVCGLMWGAARRPSILQVALESDRQLGLHDLLGSLLTMPGDDTDAEASRWRAALCTMADQRCALLKPSNLVFHRIGLRGWGGVGILTALMLVLGGMSSRPLSAIAGMTDAAAENSAAALDVPKNVLRNESVPSRPPGGGSDEAIPRRFHEHQKTADADASAIAARDGTGNKAGGGEGQATTDAKGMRIPDGEDVAEPKVNQIGETVSGSGAGAVESRDRANGSTGTGLVSDNKTAAMPPWKSDNWGEDVVRARRQAESAQTPSEDRELIEDYFEKNSQSQ